MEIPRSAVESVPGIRYLLDTIPTLPDSLSKRVTRIQPKRVLRVRTEPTELGESVVFVPQLVDPHNGKEIQSSGHCGWCLSGKRVVQEGDHFVVYQLEDQMAYNQLFGKLPSEYDPIFQILARQESETCR